LRTSAKADRKHVEGRDFSSSQPQQRLLLLPARIIWCEMEVDGAKEMIGIGIFGVEMTTN
jgi:hypothetical protein